MEKIIVHGKEMEFESKNNKLMAKDLGKLIEFSIKKEEWNDIYHIKFSTEKFPTFYGKINF